MRRRPRHSRWQASRGGPKSAGRSGHRDPGHRRRTMAATGALARPRYCSQAPLGGPLRRHSPWTETLQAWGSDTPSMRTAARHGRVCEGASRSNVRVSNRRWPCVRRAGVGTGGVALGRYRVDILSGAGSRQLRVVTVIQFVGSLRRGRGFATSQIRVDLARLSLDGDRPLVRRKFVRHRVETRRNAESET